VARQLACDIAGVRLLAVVDWLGRILPGLIRSWGGDPAKYQSYTGDSAPGPAPGKPSGGRNNWPNRRSQTLNPRTMTLTGKSGRKNQRIFYQRFGGDIKLGR